MWLGSRLNVIRKNKSPLAEVPLNFCLKSLEVLGHTPPPAQNPEGIPPPGFSMSPTMHFNPIGRPAGPSSLPRALIYNLVVRATVKL